MPSVAAGKRLFAFNTASHVVRAVGVPRSVDIDRFERDLVHLRPKEGAQ